MKPLRIILVILGSLMSLIGLAALAAGASLGWAVATQRDSDGFYTTSDQRFATTTAALTSDKIDLGEPGPDDWWADRKLATVRVRADGEGSGALFVGIGPETDVETYLAGVPHDELTDVNFHRFRAEYRRENDGGTATPAAPADQAF